MGYTYEEISKFLNQQISIHAEDYVYIVGKLLKIERVENKMVLYLYGSGANYEQLDYCSTGDLLTSQDMETYNAPVALKINKFNNPNYPESRITLEDIAKLVSRENFNKKYMLKPVEISRMGQIVERGLYFGIQKKFHNAGIADFDTSKESSYLFLYAAHIQVSSLMGEASRCRALRDIFFTINSRVWSSASKKFELKKNMGLMLHPDYELKIISDPDSNRRVLRLLFKQGVTYGIECILSQDMKVDE
jgi:hypothetical protein